MEMFKLKTADAPVLTEEPVPLDTVTGVESLTLAGRGALLDLARMISAVITFDIPGNIVECGVWRGGDSLLMASLLRQAAATDRRVWLFESFEGLTPPHRSDGLFWSPRTRRIYGPQYYDHHRASLAEVRETAEQLGVAAYTEVVKGWFDQTLPLCRERVGPISILRIDGDWYPSVRSCLDNLFDQVVDGGLIIVDDYYVHDGCRLALHDFLSERHLAYPVESVTGGQPAGQLACAVVRKASSSWNWLQRLYLTRQDIASVIPPGETFALVDEQWFDADVAGDRRAVPFVERNGEDWGDPPDDQTALTELERLRRQGVRFLAIAWPAFWWLDHYAGLNQHLRSTSRCLLENDRLVVFEFSPTPIQTQTETP